MIVVHFVQSQYIFLMVCSQFLLKFKTSSNWETQGHLRTVAETTRSRQSLEVKSSSRGEVDLFCHPTVQLVLYITNNSAQWEEDRADVWRKVLSHNLRVWAFENVRLADCVLESYGWHRRLKCGNEGGHLHLGINLTSTHTLLHCQCPLSKGMLKIGRSYGAFQIHMRLSLKILV